MMNLQNWGESSGSSKYKVFINLQKRLQRFLLIEKAIHSLSAVASIKIELRNFTHLITYCQGKQMQCRHKAVKLPDYWLFTEPGIKKQAVLG